MFRGWRGFWPLASAKSAYRRCRILGGSDYVCSVVAALVMWRARPWDGHVLCTSCGPQHADATVARSPRLKNEDAHGVELTQRRHGARIIGDVPRLFSAILFFLLPSALNMRA